MVQKSLYKSRAKPTIGTEPMALDHGFPPSLQSGYTTRAGIYVFENKLGRQTCDEQGIEQDVVLTKIVKPRVDAMKAFLKPTVILLQVLFVVGTLAPPNAPGLRIAHLRPAASSSTFRVHRPKMAAGVRHESLRAMDHPGFIAILRDHSRATAPSRFIVRGWASADAWFTTRLKIPPPGSAAIDPLA
jgi:hypothetical protein